MTVAEDIIRANYGQEGPGILQTPISGLPIQGLGGDAERMIRDEKPSEVSGEGHATHWVGVRGRVSQFQLVNETGKFEDTDSNYIPAMWDEQPQLLDAVTGAMTKPKKFHHAKAYPHIAGFLRSRKNLVNARLNVIWPGSSLAPHAENVILKMPDRSPRLKLRFHLPLLTNTKARVMVGWRTSYLEPGTIYFVHNGRPHAAWNDGDEPRAHLVWDEILWMETRKLLDTSWPAHTLAKIPDIPYPKESHVMVLDEAMRAAV